jgi:FdhD protein
MTGRAVVSLPRTRWSVREGAEASSRDIAEETPVALVHDAATTAVMMASPADLEDFAVGFSLCEGVIEQAADIRVLEIVEGDLGVEIRMWLRPDRSAPLAARRRRLAGPTGCGLCGIEGLAEAVRPPKAIFSERVRVSAAELLAAMAQLEQHQPLGRATRAAHAAALWREGGIVAAREDVGRHNALDKLVGAVARRGETASPGVLLLTSRVSVEMVQKAAVLGTPILCAISAPTGLAVRTADQAGITLVGVARADGFEVYTHSERVVL